MRPVAKGNCPYEAIARYQEARGYLIQCIGEYCSYCEMHLDAGLAVEHVQPKIKNPDKECEWENLLLGCPNCNSTKGDKEIDDNTIDDYLWPDIHNTLLALTYSESGVVGINPAVDPAIQAKAQKLISLVGLDKTPDNFPDYSDRRWLNRRNAWEEAKKSKIRLAQCDTEEMREQIAATARHGYFSIWMTVFSDDIDMKKRIIKSYPGTAGNAFDAGCNPVPRTPQGI